VEVGAAGVSLTVISAAAFLLFSVAAGIVPFAAALWGGPPVFFGNW